MWPKEHPVSVNPPLLAFAELELYSIHRDTERLRSVYPKLMTHFNYLETAFRGEDGLYYNDALGSGMDNIARFPVGFRGDARGIRIRNLYPEIFIYRGLSSSWNRQGRMVDTSAQMALFAENLLEIGEIIGESGERERLRAFYNNLKDAINRLCWDEEDGFYYDLAYGKQLKRRHVGMFWALAAGIVPEERVDRLLSRLVDPGEFWRAIPVATTSAAEKEFTPAGGYWCGSVWAPTNYMVLRGLKRYGKTEVARKLARQFYWAVAEVYKETGTFWENYAPDFVAKGDDSRPDFCGWTAIAPIAVYREFV